MQEEVENRSVALVINGTKLTARTLKSAILKYLAWRKNKKVKEPVIPRGKQSVKNLAKQDQGLSNIEVTDKNIKSFERVAKKYGVDFAIKKDKSVSPPKYLVFFKGRDADAITSAFTEFTAKTMRKAARPSVLAQLKKFTELVKNTITDRVKSKSKEQSL
ncbi:PcfB family protein [Paratissierella segnis]|uniref:PcfB family protein n=1 Tax=Paratissierella segnis TaxID=2763679 RepID=A0A926IDU2_9FIRM|nr:PcfB family protein [Paratissierella segnis]MBC8586662.1 PcfB family protein [Paratissierella segnis]